MFFVSTKTGGKTNDVAVDSATNKDNAKRLKAYAESFKKIKGAKTRGGNN